MNLIGHYLRSARKAVNARNILFHGMKRSGNHAVLRWLRSGNRFRFSDNVLPFIPLNTAGTLESQRHIPPYSKFGRLILYYWFWTYPRIISVEDMPIDRWLFATREPHGIRNVLLLRSPENLFASRIRRGFASESPAYPCSLNEIMLRTRRLWIQHAREALEETSFLKNKVTIFYDRWLVDPEYRGRIATKLKISPDDTSMSVQAHEGRGSSFSLDARQSLPSPVADLLSRSQFLNEDERSLLDSVLDEPELHRLRAKLLTIT